MQPTTAEVTQDAQAVLRKNSKHKILSIIFLLAVRTLTDFQMQFKSESSIRPSCILTGTFLENVLFSKAGTFAFYIKISVLPVFMTAKLKIE